MPTSQPHSRARALGRLLRLSLAPSAAADIAVGIVVGGAGHWPAGARSGLLVGASLAVYHGALALNDWADREADARTRPDRPLPSGAIRAPTAAALAAALLALGVALAFLAEPLAALWMAGLGLLAAAYDLVGRGPWAGPGLLAACRAANLGAGVAFGARWVAGPAPALAALPPLLYGAYVFAVSRLGRLEDDEDPRPLGRRPARALLLAALCLAAVPAALGPVDPLCHALSAGLAWWGAAGLVRVARAPREWTRADVGRATGTGLRRLLVFTAACALLLCSSGPAAALVAACALAGYPLSFALRRVFPPT